MNQQCNQDCSKARQPKDQQQERSHPVKHCIYYIIAMVVGILIALCVGYILIVYTPSKNFIKLWPALVALIIGILKAIKDWLDDGHKKAKEIEDEHPVLALFYTGFFFAYNAFILVGLYVVVLFAFGGIDIKSVL